MTNRSIRVNTNLRRGIKALSLGNGGGEGDEGQRKEKHCLNDQKLRLAETGEEREIKTKTGRRKRRENYGAANWG